MAKRSIESITLPRHMTSTPIRSPESRSDQFEATLKSALDLIMSCIANSDDLVKTCDQYQKDEGNEMSAGFKKIFERVTEDAKMIVKLKAKFIKVNESVKSGDLESIKKEFDSMINSIENISSEKLKMFSDLLCLTETSNVRKRFAESEKELNSMDPNLFPDEKTRKFGKLLAERNKKVISCLDYFYALLPKLPDV